MSLASCTLCLAIAQVGQGLHAQRLAQPAATSLSDREIVESVGADTGGAAVRPLDPTEGDASTDQSEKGSVSSEAAKPIGTNYSGKLFLRQAKAIPWRLGGAATAITLTGIANWDWGSSPFHFHREGWFGKDTKSLGMDKLGHGYSAFVLTDFFTDGIDRASPGGQYRSYTAGLLAMGMMTYIEVFDGFSKDHGFSPEDLAVDAAGVAVSIVRRAVPGLRDKVDFRLLYLPDKDTFHSLRCLPRPSCNRGGVVTAHSPITDYSNQRYLLALKLAGFRTVKRTPLRLIEVQAGYYARGYTAEDQFRGEPLRRRIFFGLGLNVGELLFVHRRGWAGKAARSALEYLQVPYTAVYNQ